MANIPNLIVMLTHCDQTVRNAREVFEQCKDAKAQYWGFKESPLPLDEMVELFALMRSCGKTTVLEVVSYDEEACLEGARKAVTCGCDILMGTMFFDSVNELCAAHGIKYLPFVGDVTGRPSVLDGNPDDMIEQARACLDKGAYGIDLLGYRYTGDAVALNEQFVARLNAPVCIAGSINSFERLDEVKAAAPWAFTIGAAFFDGKFGDSFREQIDCVVDYMNGANEGSAAC